MKLTTLKSQKKMHLTIGSRFTRRVEAGSKFGFPRSEFCTEFGYRVGLVGSARVADLMGLTRNTRFDS